MGFTEYLWLDGLLVAVFTPTGLHRIETDHLGTPRMAKGQYGNKTWRSAIEDNAFGKKPAEVIGDGDSPGLELNLRFPGQYFDQETGLHYNYFRDYDPGVGRYVESDPIGLSGGHNLYSYALANPITLIDPLGLDVRCPPGQKAVPFPGQENRFPTIFECEPSRGAPTHPQCPFGECGAFPETYNSKCSIQCDEGPLASCLAIVASAAAPACRPCITSRFRDSKSCISCSRRVNQANRCIKENCEVDDCCE